MIHSSIIWSVWNDICKWSVFGVRTTYVLFSVSAQRMLHIIWGELVMVILTFFNQSTSRTIEKIEGKKYQQIEESIKQILAKKNSFYEIHGIQKDFRKILVFWNLEKKKTRSIKIQSKAFLIILDKCILFVQIKNELWYQ